MSMMLKVLRPTSRILVDCATDVIVAYRANTSLLTKIVDVICQYHDECKEETWGTEDGCFSMESEVEFGDANVTSAIMHWLYEVLRSGA
ncbi:hypothetical protein MTO96_016383 [Rhipicephalus appendiculatus]